MTGPAPVQEVKTLSGTVTAFNGEVPQQTLSKPSALLTRPKTNGDATSRESLPPPGHALTGKQEHCMMRTSTIKRQC